MYSGAMPELQQCQRLAAGHAATVRPVGAATVLVVLRGLAWVTLDPPVRGAEAPRGGDWFLGPGDSLPLERGATAVLEAVDPDGKALQFGWREPGPIRVPAAIRRPAKFSWVCRPAPTGASPV